MQKIIPFLAKYWYLPLFVVLLVGYLLKKKKPEVENKDESSAITLSARGVKDKQSQDVYKNITAQIAEALGTSYSWYNPFKYWENDEKVYNLLKDLTLQDFSIVKKLYFDVYAKGRDLSSDLASLLDDKYYKILKNK